jgi:hypothetical protein
MVEMDVSPIDSETLSKEAHKFGLKTTSGQRSVQHNAAVGGSPTSHHLTGNAFDFAGDPAKMKQFYDHMRDTYGGRFSEILNEGNHVHVAWDATQQLQSKAKAAAQPKSLPPPPSINDKIKTLQGYVSGPVETADQIEARERGKKPVAPINVATGKPVAKPFARPDKPSALEKFTTAAGETYEGFAQFPVELGKVALDSLTGKPAAAGKKLWSLLAEPQIAEYRKAQELTKKKGYKDGRAALADPEILGHWVAAGLPMVGPMAAHAGERWGSGDFAGAAGETFAILAPMGISALKGKAAEGVKTVAAKLPKELPKLPALDLKLEVPVEETIAAKAPAAKGVVAKSSKKSGITTLDRDTLKVEVNPDRIKQLEKKGETPEQIQARLDQAAQHENFHALIEQRDGPTLKAVAKWAREKLPKTAGERIAQAAERGDQPFPSDAIEHRFIKEAFGSPKVEPKLPPVPGTTGEVATKPVAEVAGKVKEPWEMTQAEYQKSLEFGDKNVSLKLEDAMSDPQTLYEEARAGKLKDGLYEGGDDHVYQVTGKKVELLPRYKAQFDYKTNSFTFTERSAPSANVADRPLFHGTDQKGLTYDKLDAERSGRNFQAVGGNEFKGVYFSTVPGRGAKTFGDNVVEARLKPDARIVTYQEASGRSTEELLREGIDAITKYEKGGDYGEVIVLNPKALREGAHESSVRGALSKGKSVSPEVLADYPDLVAKYAKPTKAPKAEVTLSPVPKANFEMTEAERSTTQAAAENFRSTLAFKSVEDLSASKAKIKKLLETERGSGGPSTELLKEMAKVGAHYIESGLKDFASWSKQVLADLGDSAKPYLVDLWAKSNAELQSLRETPPKMERRSLPETLEEHGLLGGEDRFYNPAPNVRSLDRATQMADGLMAEKGIDGAVEWLKQSPIVGPEQTALGIKLQDMLQDKAVGLVESDPEAANALMDKAQDIAESMSTRLTRYGQAVQAVQVVEKLHPTRVLRTAQKVYAEAHKGAKLPNEKATALTTAAKEIQKAKRQLAEYEKMRRSSEDPKWQVLIDRAEDDILRGRKKLANEMQSLDPFAATKHKIGSVVSMLRSIKTAYDLSAPGRQGWIGSVLHPYRGFVVPFWEQLRAIGKVPDPETRWGKYQLENLNLESYRDFEADILLDPIAQEMRDLGYDAFTRAGQHVHPELREETFRSDPANKIPGIARSEQAFSTYRNVQGKGLYKIYRGWIDRMEQSKLLSADEAVNAKKGILKFIADAVGRGGLAKEGSMLGSVERSAIATHGLFAYRWLKSRFNLMNPVYYAKLPKGARMIAATEMTRFVATTGSTMYLLQQLGAQVETDPESSDFLKVRFGNTHYDISAGFQNELRFMFRFSKAVWDQSSGEMIKKQGSPTGWVDKEGKVRQNAAEIWNRFWRSKLAPVPGAAADVAYGDTFEYDPQTGKPLAPSIGREASQLIEPMVEKDLREAWGLEGSKGAMKALPTVIGIGVQTYKPKAKKPGFSPIPSMSGVK